MDSKKLNHLLNPIRMKIVLTILKTGPCTKKDLEAVMQNVPQASLYRHIKKLKDEKVIEVVKRKKKRGTIERTFGLRYNPFDEMNQAGIENDLDKVNEMFYTFAMTLLMDFNQYIEKPGVNLAKDSVGFRSFPIYMNEEENKEFTEDLRKLVTKFIENSSDGNRTMRKFSFVYMPGE